MALLLRKKTGTVTNVAKMPVKLKTTKIATNTQNYRECRQREHQGGSGIYNISGEDIRDTRKKNSDG
jgi:hypothetical protein